MPPFSPRKLKKQAISMNLKEQLSNALSELSAERRHKARMKQQLNNALCECARLYEENKKLKEAREAA